MDHSSASVCTNLHKSRSCWDIKLQQNMIIVARSCVINTVYRYYHYIIMCKILYIYIYIVIVIYIIYILPWHPDQNATHFEAKFFGSLGSWSLRGFLLGNLKTGFEYVEWCWIEILWSFLSPIISDFQRFSECTVHSCHKMSQVPFSFLIFLWGSCVQDDSNGCPIQDLSNGADFGPLSDTHSGQWRNG